jgi:hypothetical protein
MNCLQRLITAVEDFRIFHQSLIHVHSTTPRPLMAVDQCVVCYALTDNQPVTWGNHV